SASCRGSATIRAGSRWTSKSSPTSGCPGCGTHSWRRCRRRSTETRHEAAMRLLGSLLLLIGVTLLIRSTALTALASRGIMIDALAFATVVWALRHGESWGTGFGFALGVSADLDA